MRRSCATTTNTKQYGWGGSSWGTPTNEIHYLCDHKLPIQERNASNQPQVTYTRGLDLGGSTHSAGGIGGLLARTDANGPTFYHADGAGNITALINSAGTRQATYLYDPFGNTLGMSGALAAVNSHRFSSKEVDGLSGEYYYGLRFYDPNLQRWLNKDPLGLAGGVNLYGFVGNDPMDNFDADGLLFRCQFKRLGKWLSQFFAGNTRPADPNSYLAMRTDMLGSTENIVQPFVQNLVTDIGDLGTDALLQAALAEVAGPLAGALGDGVGVLADALGGLADESGALADAAGTLADEAGAAADATSTATETATERLGQDIAVNPTAPDALPTSRPIGGSATQNAAAQQDIATLRSQGYSDIRVNQQQVNGAGQRVGINRPDIQATSPTGQRVYIEYDTSTSTRAVGHQLRILANDPSGMVILKTVD